jgi:hypothetical protein
MSGRRAHPHTLSPVVLLATAAMLSVGSVADGAALYAGGGGDREALLHLVEAITATAGALADDDAGVPASPAAWIALAPVVELSDLSAAAALPRLPRVAGVRVLRAELTHLPPPLA